MFTKAHKLFVHLPLAAILLAFSVSPPATADERPTTGLSTVIAPRAPALTATGIVTGNTAATGSFARKGVEVKGGKGDDDINVGKRASTPKLLAPTIHGSKGNDSLSFGKGVG